jgi:hypothetical protein
MVSHLGRAFGLQQAVTMTTGSPTGAGASSLRQAIGLRPVAHQVEQRLP